MATLSLKKPKKIGESPLQNLQNKFVVVRQARKQYSCRFTAYHDVFDDALREAKRLQKTQPDQRFLVLQVQGYVDFEQIA
jgi:hypothetical protein